MPLLVGSDEAYNILPARGTSCILSRLCSIFNLVCSTFYFSAVQVVVLHSLELLFTRLHGLVPLAGGILRGIESTSS